jgi:hypothetical protein
MTSLQSGIFSTVVNLSSHVPKIYAFVLADAFGLFWPSAISSVLEIMLLVVFFQPIQKLSKNGFQDTNTTEKTKSE